MCSLIKENQLKASDKKIPLISGFYKVLIGLLNLKILKAFSY